MSEGVEGGVCLGLMNVIEVIINDLVVIKGDCKNEREGEREREKGRGDERCRGFE